MLGFLFVGLLLLHSVSAAPTPPSSSPTTDSPVVAPPTSLPSAAPTLFATSSPTTIVPSSVPTRGPTPKPTALPSTAPTVSNTAPSTAPNARPATNPTSSPSLPPTASACLTPSDNWSFGSVRVPYGLKNNEFQARLKSLVDECGGPAGVTKLLDISNNDLTYLWPGMFDNFTNLTGTLDLSYNNIGDIEGNSAQGLPLGIFDKLTRLSGTLNLCGPYKGPFQPRRIMYDIGCTPAFDNASWGGCRSIFGRPQTNNLTVIVGDCSTSSSNGTYGYRVVQQPTPPTQAPTPPPVDGCTWPIYGNSEITSPTNISSLIQKNWRISVSNGNSFSINDLENGIIASNPCSGVPLTVIFWDNCFVRWFRKEDFALLWKHNFGPVSINVMAYRPPRHQGPPPMCDPTKGNCLIDIEVGALNNPKLVQLRLNYQNLSNVPDGAIDFTNLEQLALAGMHSYNGVYLNFNISNATKLVEVDLSVNLMRTLPGGLLDTPSIKRLNLADNYLDPASLDFTKLINLEWTDLTGRNYAAAGESPPRMTAFPKFNSSSLKSLTFDKTQLERVTSLAGAPNLEHLQILWSLDQVHSPVFDADALVKNTNLKSLSIALWPDYQPDEMVLPKGFFSGQGKLEALYLGGHFRLPSDMCSNMPNLKDFTCNNCLGYKLTSTEFDGCTKLYLVNIEVNLGNDKTKPHMEMPNGTLFNNFEIEKFTLHNVLLPPYLPPAVAKNVRQLKRGGHKPLVGNELDYFERLQRVTLCSSQYPVTLFQKTKQLQNINIECDESTTVSLLPHGLFDNMPKLRKITLPKLEGLPSGIFAKTNITTVVWTAIARNGVPTQGLCSGSEEEGCEKMVNALNQTINVTDGYDNPLIPPKTAGSRRARRQQVPGPVYFRVKEPPEPAPPPALSPEVSETVGLASEATVATVSVGANVMSAVSNSGSASSSGGTGGLEVLVEGQFIGVLTLLLQQKQDAGIDPADKEYTKAATSFGKSYLWTLGLFDVCKFGLLCAKDSPITADFSDLNITSNSTNSTTGASASAGAGTATASGGSSRRLLQVQSENGSFMENNSSEVLLAYWLGLLGLLLLVVSWDLGVGKMKGLPDREDRFCGHCASLLIVVFPGFFTTHSNHSLNTGQLVLFWISLSLVTCMFAFYAKLIWTSPKDCLYTNKFFLRYGSLYRPFKEDRRHFSLFSILYQLLVALPLFLPPGQAQLTLVATTHSLWAVLLLVFRPYWNPVLQGLKTALAAFKVVVVIVVFYAKLIEVIVPLYVVVLILSLSSSVFQKLKRYTSQDKYLISVLEPVTTTTKQDQKDHPKSALQLPPDSTEMQSI